jgi:hypothetical protein
MRAALVQALGIAATVLYGAFIAWIYATQPRTLQEVATGAQVAAGTYEVDGARFQAGLDLFRREQFRAARDEWSRADPARRDPRTQFYAAYSYYRQGWGRLYNDDRLFKAGLDTVNRAIEVAPGNRLVVDDQTLGMRSADELKAELQRGLTREAGDLNPLRVFEPRK